MTLPPKFDSNPKTPCGLRAFARFRVDCPDPCR
jgi:hypothetical protein